MDSHTQERDGHGIEACADPFLSSASTETNDIDEKYALLPRIGDQYQVKIPSLDKEWGLHLRRISACKMPAHVASPGIELAIPIMWVCHPGDKINAKREKEECRNDGIVSLNLQKNDSGSFDSKSKTLDIHMLHNSDNAVLPCNSRFTTELPDLLNPATDLPNSANDDGKEKDHKEICSSGPQIRKSGHYPLPRSPPSFWNDAETQDGQSAERQEARGLYMVSAYFLVGDNKNSFHAFCIL